MIDFTSYKRIYSKGDMFTLTGSDFQGYIEYSNGQVVAADSKQMLTSKNTYKTDVFTSDIFFDRVTTDTNIALPYPLQECLFGLNEELSYESIRNKFDKLRYNTAFAYSRMFIAASNLPSAEIITYACLTGKNDEELTTRTVHVSSPEFLESNLFIGSSAFSQLYYITDATAQSNYEYEDRYAWFAVASSTFISITGSPTSINIIEQSNYIESTENEVSFGTLGGIASNSRFLFISDTSQNVIYKYDIAGYLNNDSVLNNKRNLIELIGGTGNSSNKFNGVTKLACDEERLAAYDSGNKTVKVYDINFNYITKVKTIKEPVFCMGFDPHFKNLYVITSSNNRVYLYRFDECFTSFERIELSEQTIGIEEPAQIEFSKNNSNIWYLVTTQRVFKKFKSRPSPFVGVFDERNLFSQGITWSLSSVLETRQANNYWNNTASPFMGSLYKFNLLFSGCDSESTELSSSGLASKTYKGFNIFGSNLDSDRIVMISDSRLYYFYEPNVFERVIKQENYTNYGINGFNLNRDEYIQTSSINNELYKLIYDIISLKNNIVGRFSGKYQGDNIMLDDYNYNLSFSDFLISDDKEFYVHGNEKNVTGVINRTLTKIYDLQLKLMNLIAIDIARDPQNTPNSGGVIEI